MSSGFPSDVLDVKVTKCCFDQKYYCTPFLPYALN